MKLFKTDFVEIFLLIAESIAAIALCVLVYHFFSAYAGLLLLAVNVFFLLFVYQYLRYRYQKLLNRYVQTMSESVKSVSRDYNIPICKLNDDPFMKEFFLQLDTLRSFLVNRDHNRQELLNIVNSIAVNIDLDKLLEDIMPKLTEATRSTCCAFYMANNATNKLELKQSIGFSKSIYAEFDITIGEGFLGAASLSKDVTIINDLPDDTPYIMRTFLGKIKPKNVMLIPILKQEQLVGIFVFAGLYEYSESVLELVDLMKYYVGVALGNGITYERTKRLTKELQFQNKLIQNMNDELERKVQDRTLYLNSIIDSIKDYAIYAMDKNGVIMLWNNGAEILFGYTAEEILGKHVETLYLPQEVEDGAITRRINDVTRDGKLVESGWRQKRDGSGYYAEMMLFCIYDDKGNILGYTNVTRDTTTLKKAESALLLEKEMIQKILNGSARAIVLANDQGTIEMTTPRAEDALMQGDLVGKVFYDFFANPAELKQTFEQAVLFGEEASWTFQLARQNRWIEIHLSILTEDSTQSTKLFMYLHIKDEEYGLPV